MTERETFIGYKAWRMSGDLTPTFSDGRVVARIRWRPVALAAWEIVVGERGLCSLPRFRSADEAKLDAWEKLEGVHGAGP